ncbi:MAG: hypothetical protein K9H64_09310, partial [Bacteroidales bacterium]|nr:hypothetical protein [Bacteroidales bacterium]MCF8456063.1 hypothetical protein [Bacteroidales bacterium]
MKKITFFLSFLILTGIMFAQAPNAFKYQAIARDVNGDLIANQNVGILIKIIQSSTNGVVKYAESHLVTTNQFGLIDLEIGNGTVVSGIFSSINWAQGPFFLRVEMDVAGGTAYQLMGVSQLLAVPYALYAEKSGSTTQGQGIMSYTQFEIDTLTANPGTMVYNTTTNCMNFYNGSVWTELCGDPPCTPWPTNAIAGPEQWVYGTTTTLAANTPVDGIGQWSYSGGTINEIGNPNSLFSGDPGQTYLLYWTINTFCGSSTDSVYIHFVLCNDNNNCTYDYFLNGNCYFDPIILNIANAGPDQSVFGTSAVLAGNAAVSGGTGVWSKISGNGGSFSNTLNPLATFTGLNNTEYLLKWKITDSCWTSSDTVKISFSTCDDGDPCTYDYFSNGTCYHDPITPTVAVAGDNQLVYTIAATGSTSLLANEAIIGTGTWSVLSGTGGTFDDPSNHAATFTGSANETYNLQWQISHTCDTTSDELTVTFTNCNDGNPCTNDYFANGVCHNDPILPTAAFAGNDQTVNGTSTTLDANTPSFGTGLWYVVSGTNPSFSSVSEPNATFSGNNGTQYILTWVVNSPCGSSIDTVIINFFNCDDNDPCTEDLWDATNQICTHTPIVVPVANAGADQFNVPGPVTLAGNSAGPGTGSWSIWDGMSGSLADPSDPQSSFSGIIGNSYTLVWTITHPCSTTTDTVIVSIGATFVCGTAFLDTRDNQTYNTVDINGRCWMAENLNYGDFVTTAQGQANNSIAEKFGYANDPLNCATKGGLYTWDELMQYSTTDSAQGLCPTGWYIPSDAEWYEMENFVDNSVNDPTAINYRGTDIHLKLIDGGSSGLDLIYSGVFYAPNGNFFGGGTTGRFGVYATSTENPPKAWMRTIHENNTGVSRTSDFKSIGISVRCIKSGPSAPPCSPQPSQANAGSDQVDVTGTSVTLDANPPTSGTGQWSVWSGQGGTLSDSSLANSSFTGIPGQAYELTWTVSTSCGSNSDNVLISFMDTSANTFSCGSPYTDTRDNQTYNTVEINGRCWLAQNLNYGTAVTPAQGQVNNSIAEKYCYNNDPLNCNTRGGLYTWNEMMDYSTADSAQGLCPSGWHIPSDAEWYEMENFVDTSVNDPTFIGYRGSDIHTKLMQGGSSGLDLIFTGTYFQPGNVFYGGGNINKYSNYATSTESGTSFWIRTINENNTGVSRDVLSKLWGNPVRCIKDDSAPPCSPQPSQANAGPDQLDMPGASLVLAAELPTSGIGQWSIVSGQNGSFTNTASNTSTFSGTTGQVYQLAWTVSTACGSSSDEVSVSFVCSPMPTTANAGPDMLNVLSDSVILAANLPLEGIGQWSVVSGQGGTFSNTSLYNSSFNGIPGQAYELSWTISTICGSSIDNILVSFMDTATVICGTSLLDTRDNQTYDIVEINGRCWLAQNLNYGDFVTTTQGQANNSIAEKFCYSNDSLNCATKGGLYTWDELMQYSTADSAQGICPTGWHVPSDA